MCPHFSVLLSGSYSENLDGDVFHCTPGSVLFKPSDAVHGNSFPAPATSLIVEIEESSLENDVLSEYLKAPRQESSASVQRMLFTIRAELRTKEPLAELIIQAAILELLGRLARAGDIVNRQSVSEAIDFLRDNVTRNVTLTEIATAVGVPTPKLARDFSAATGLSIGEYLRRYRVDLGITALTTSRKTVSAIAAELGFSDHSHFTRVFKQATGYTPASLRAFTQ